MARPRTVQAYNKGMRSPTILVWPGCAKFLSYKGKPDMSARNQLVSSFGLIPSRIRRNILYNPVFEQAATELQEI
jgi:hypothetical protein